MSTEPKTYKMNKLNAEKRRGFSIAKKLSQLNFFTNRKNINDITVEITNATQTETDNLRTRLPATPKISTPKTVRFTDSNRLLNLNDEISHSDEYLSVVRLRERSHNDAENTFMENETRNCTRNKNNNNRHSMDAAQVFMRYKDHEERKTSREKRARSLTRLQRVMWSQRRNTIGTDETGSPKQSPLKISTNGVILRQKNPFRGSRLSIFQNSTETFLTLIRNPEKRKSFRAFLESEYSEENLDFWVQCEEYRQLKPKMRKKAASKIFQTFLGDDAHREINIDAGTRARTESQLQNPQEDTFDEAQRHIFDLMERDSFRRFIMSDKPW